MTFGRSEPPLNKPDPDSPLLKQGSSRAALNTATLAIDAMGQRLPAQLADYTYTVPAGQATITYHLSYLLVTLPFDDLPAVHLRPERLSDRLSAAVGFDDIDFEDAEFSRAYHVSSNDKRFAYALIDPRVIEHLASARYPASIEIEGQHLLLYRGHTPDGKTDARWSPDQCDERIAFATELLERWPDHLKRAEGSVP